jgi:hypothetical protein
MHLKFEPLPNLYIPSAWKPYTFIYSKYDNFTHSYTFQLLTTHSYIRLNPKWSHTHIHIYQFLQKYDPLINHNWKIPHPFTYWSGNYIGKLKNSTHSSATRLYTIVYRKWSRCALNWTRVRRIHRRATYLLYPLCRITFLMNSMIPVLILPLFIYMYRPLSLN